VPVSAKRGEVVAVSRVHLHVFLKRSRSELLFAGACDGISSSFRAFVNMIFSISVRLLVTEQLCICVRITDMFELEGGMVDGKLLLQLLLDRRLHRLEADPTVVSLSCPN
jgi:hypothetical protein